MKRKTVQMFVVAGLFGLVLTGRPVPSAAQVNFTAPELIGRPTDSAVTVNAVADQDIDVYFEYGTISGTYSDTTDIETFPAGEPIEMEIDGLSSNTRYYYRMRYREAGDTSWSARDEHRFHTQRSPGNTFTFTVVTDSHVGWPWFADAILYDRTLTNVNADNPDFHIDLGDTFTMDPAFGQSAVDEARARQVYLEQRGHMGEFSHSAAVFLVVGNHENEEGWNLDDTLDPLNSLPILSSNARKRYYLNPVPNGFYTGNTDDSCAYCQYVDDDHLREDYYAWQWGDALFVTVDPFWNTPNKPYPGNLGGEVDDEMIGDVWDWSLGEDQYLWLKETLEQSNAKYKFVFAHQVAGDGLRDIDYAYGRGGGDAAHNLEWGGHNVDGTWGWDTHRPTWEAPIHQLMVENEVTVFFHGHDHVYAEENVDGILYLECPRPDDSGYTKGFDYYDQDAMIANSGHVRVTVSSGDVVIEYIRSYLDGDGNNGEVARTRTIPFEDIEIAPVTSDQSFNTPEDTPLTVSLDVDDPDDYLFDLEIVSPPGSGTATVNPGNTITYTPDPNAHGSDSLIYEVTDHDGLTDSAEISVNVSSVNDGPPRTVSDSASLPKSGSIVIDVLANDTVDDFLGSLDIQVGPNHGDATVQPDNTILFQAKPGYKGDDSFIYEVTDLDGESDVAVVFLTITPK